MGIIWKLLLLSKTYGVGDSHMRDSIVVARVGKDPSLACVDSLLSLEPPQAVSCD